LQKFTAERTEPKWPPLVTNPPYRGEQQVSNPWGLEDEGAIIREDGSTLAWDFAADGTGAAIITKLLPDGAIEVIKELTVKRVDGQEWITETGPLPPLEKLKQLAEGSK
jgi:hypothetical protein